MAQALEGRSRRVAVVAIAAATLSRPVAAFNPQPDPPFGMFGIAQGQTARLNLVNFTNELPPPCRVTAEVFDNTTGRSELFVVPPPCRGAACWIND